MKGIIKYQRLNIKIYKSKIKNIWYLICVFDFWFYLWLKQKGRKFSALRLLCHPEPFTYCHPAPMRLKSNCKLKIINFQFPICILQWSEATIGAGSPSAVQNLPWKNWRDKLHEEFRGSVLLIVAPLRSEWQTGKDYHVAMLLVITTTITLTWPCGCRFAPSTLRVTRQGRGITLWILICHFAFWVY
jgi:hypothetical protein